MSAVITQTESRSRQKALIVASDAGLLSRRDMAKLCGVRPRMIDWWITTGAWPLPCSVCRDTVFFKRTDLDCWLLSGVWPAGVRFRGSGHQSKTGSRPEPS